MMQVEFQNLIGETVTNEEFEIINTVYTFHPSISETDGKKQIANLYKTFGYRIIKDMLATAIQAEKYESEITNLYFRLEQVKQDFQNFKDGEEIEE